MKIDIVVTWVDGSDAHWQNERNLFVDELMVDNDYRDTGLFKFWFRAVEKYLPWINKIHLVTMGHIPDFLNINHPKLSIVKHTDFIPSEYLPTFSANTIELNIHRIKGLSPHFLYFNDDVFVLSSLSPTDFFVDDKVVDIGVITPIMPARYNSISNLMCNNIGCLNDKFNMKAVIRNNRRNWFSYKYGHYALLSVIFSFFPRFVGFYEPHLVTPFKKENFDKVWDLYFEQCHNTCLNKVRNFKIDVNHWLIRDYQLVTNQFVARKRKFGKYLMLNNENDVKNACHIIANQKYPILCLNDHFNDSINVDEMSELLVSVFGELLHEKSSFEK